MKTKILVIEDDVAINQLLVQMLKDDYEVTSAFSGSEAKLLLAQMQPDLILLDLMLPGVVGEDLLTYIREEKGAAMPILILSAKTDLENKVNLLKKGADDYINKPFEPAEVLARIEVALRRNQGNQQKEVLAYKNLTLDSEARKVMINETEITLTVYEYDILFLLMENPKKVYSRELLYERVWKGGYYGENNTVNVHVSNLRKKLKEIDENEEYIQTVYGIGFKLQ